MTSKQDTPENILPVKKTEPIHFLDEDGERILVQCLVLEESDNTDDFLINAVGELPALVITNVEPAKEDDESVTLTFRNLSNIEILERIGTGILPIHLLDALFPDTDDIIREEVEQALGGKDKVEEADLQTLQMLRIGLLISHHAELPTVNETTEFKANVSLDATHLAQIINVSTGGPAFAVMASGTFNAYKRRKIVNRPLVSDLTTLSFPIYGSNDFTTATEVLTQKLTGHYLISPTKASEHKVRGDLLALIIGLSNGSKDALIKTFRLLNSTTKSVDAIRRRSEGDYSVTPSVEQIENVVLNEIVEQAYQLLTSDTLSRIVPTGTPTLGSMPGMLSDTDTEMLKQLFESSGLDDVFQNILDSQEETPLDVPEPEASLENILDYFSSKITLSSFPNSMERLKDSIHFPVLFDHNWADEEPEDENHELSPGAILVAKIFTLAVRYARLQNLALTTELPVNPVAVLVQTLSGGNEPSFWALEETIRRLPQSPDGIKLFSEVLTSGLVHPKIAAGPLSIDLLIRSLVPALLHRTGHIILQENWKHEEIMNILAPYSLLTPFIDGLYEEDDDEDGDLLSHERNCVALEAAVQALTAIDFQEQGVEIVEELGSLLVELANIKATEELPELDAKDQNYKTFLENYLVTQLIYNGMI